MQTCLRCLRPVYADGLCWYHRNLKGGKAWGGTRPPDVMPHEVCFVWPNEVAQSVKARMTAARDTAAAVFRREGLIAWQGRVGVFERDDAARVAAD